MFSYAIIEHTYYFDSTYGLCSNMVLKIIQGKILSRKELIVTKETNNNYSHFLVGSGFIK